MRYAFYMKDLGCE
jgi:hypothetical protein